MPTDSNQKPDSPKDALLNILFNLIIPVAILTKGSTEDKLGPMWGLLFALVFPLAYGAYDLITKKKWNFVSLLGLVSVLLTGGLALLKLDGIWFAVKEALIPSLIGIGVFFSAKSKFNVVKLVILNPKILELEKIEDLITTKGLQKEYDNLVVKSTYFLVFSFIVSAILNFVLAVVILKSPTGTEAFNQELGKMTALSFPVIMVPSTLILFFALWFLLKGISKMTGTELQDLLKNT